MLSSFPNIQVEYNFQDHFIAVLSKGENQFLSKQAISNSKLHDQIKDYCAYLGTGGLSVVSSVYVCKVKVE